MKTAVLITTYNREESLLKIIDKIITQVDHIYIVDDSSQYDIYHSLKDYKDKITLLINGSHMGKAGYYKTVSRLFSLVQKTKYDYYFMIPDDMMPADNWLEKSISLWESIDHSSKICLSIYSDASRFMLPCWSQFQPQMISDDIILSQWMDLCFMATYDFFDKLAFQIPDPEIDYQEQPLMSSGVGRYISRNMNGMRQLMFHTVKSLMLPMDESQKSQMNANERAIHPKINKPIKLSQKKYAGLATIPGREKMMKKAVESMLPQVDHIYISLNNYTKIPAWMDHKKITAIFNNNSKGDSSKFSMANYVDGFFFSIDDDLIYPPHM
jgi:glycosyltransferase involved in cell wall biosynthesis